MTSLSTHVLDTTLGRPVAALAVTLAAPDGRTCDGLTDSDGRCRNWSAEDLAPGRYCLRFHTGDYLRTVHGSAFYPHVDIWFEITEAQGHYHIPLLLSPFGFSSYRGS